MLERALESLIAQTLDKALYEIIVVENASTDATPEVMSNFQVKYRECNIVLVHEDCLGLGYARNTGFRYVRGAYVAFIDDDSRADKDWLRLALDSFEHVKPIPSVVGGPIFPFYDSPGPAWFKDEYEIRTWGHKPRFLKKGESFSGSNMIFRREAIEKYSGFDVSVGMKGDYLSMGEETSLIEKIWRDNSDGVGLYYSPELLVFHAVSPYKMTLSYQLKRAFVTGQLWYLRYGTKSLAGQIIAILDALVVLARLSFLALFHIAESSALHHWVIERICPIVIEIGRLFGCFGIIIPVRQRQR